VTSLRPVPSPTLLSGASLPGQLADLPRPPEVAYLWGQLPPGPCVGLVGTRDPSARGLRIAFEAARRLAALGVTIVSGGAKGIDRAAHLGALSARAPTLVVAPAWLGRATPKQNHRLFDAVLARGGGYLTVASETDALIHPTFVRRNEVLVALCDVILFGEMGVPSGALIAAKFARQTGVPRFVLPWHPSALDTRGTQSELERGARPFFHPTQLVRMLEGRTFENPVYWERSRLAVEAHEAALEWRAERRRGKQRPKGKKARADRAPGAAAKNPRHGAREDDAVLSAIARGASTIDAVVEATLLAAAVVQHRVLLLTLEGSVVKDSGGLLRSVG